MPMTLNVGLSKKVGLPDYGSVGASCSVQVELDAQLLREDLDGFHVQVCNAYAACRQAVQDELSRHQTNGMSEQPVTDNDAPAGRTGRHNGNGHSTTSNGNVAHSASQKQLDYITQLARQIRGLGIRRVETLAEKMFGKPLAGLNSLDASGLIDMLKSVKAGDVDLNDVLEDAAPRSLR